LSASLIENAIHKSPQANKSGNPQRSRNSADPSLIEHPKNKQPGHKGRVASHYFTQVQFRNRCR